MKRLFICIIILYSISSCTKNAVIIEDIYAPEFDTKAFELVINSFLEQEAYTQQNFLVSTFPNFEDTTITKNEWANWLQSTNIEQHRERVLDGKNLQSIKIEDYRSCNFPMMLPPTVEQDQELSKTCDQFLNTYALTTTLPKQLMNTENNVSVVVGLFSNAGYSYFKFIITSGEELRIISKEKISGVYS